MIIYIAEKKSLGERVAKALGGGRAINGYIEGSGWRVCFCRGHILEMLDPKEYAAEWENWSLATLPMIPDVWKLKPKKDTKRLLDIIRESLKKATMAVNVGDGDREGQLLVDEVLDFLNWKGETKRLWFSDQSQKFINDNINNLQPNEKFIGYKNQALARGRADWVIGLNATRAYTLQAKKQGFNDLLSVGRVQTPTLALIVGRDLEIENFVSKPFYEVSATFNHENGEYKGSLQLDEAPSEEGRVTDKGFIDGLISQINVGDAGNIIEYTQTEKMVNQPICFSKSDLVEACYKAFGYDGDHVLRIAQSLYDEHEATTYPRTDCGYLPQSKHAQGPQVLSNLAQISQFKGIIDHADSSILSRVWDDAKLTAHDGIIPTETVSIDQYNKMNTEEKNVFGVIVKRYVAQFYNPEKAKETAFITQINKHKFKTSGKIVLDSGWKVLYASEKNKSTDSSLPSINDGDYATVLSTVRVDKMTKAPEFFNDGNIEKAMKNIGNYLSDPEAKKALKENEGIGEESTRSNIVLLLKKRGYIKTTGKKLVSTTLGRALIDIIKGDIKSPLKTALMERDLKRIESGELSVDDYVSTQSEYAVKIVSEAVTGDYSSVPKGVEVECPDCEKGKLRKIKTKTGSFFGCSEYANGCKGSYPDLGGKPYIEKFDCECGEKLTLIKGKTGPFFKCVEGCSKTFNVEKNKPAVDNMVEGVVCPKCEGQLLIRISSKKKEFYPCSKGCGFAAFKNRDGDYSYNENNEWITL